MSAGGGLRFASDPGQRRAAVRLLKKLGTGVGHLKMLDDGASRLTCRSDGRTVRLEPEFLVGLVSADIIERRAGDQLVMTAAGRAWLRRALSGGDDYRAQHQQRGHETRLADNGSRISVCVDLTESPLAWLARRKRPDGSLWLSTAQLAAGERLREDFTRGGMMTRVTADWSGAVRAGGRRSGQGGADICDAAMAARDRVRTALDGVGSGLCEVLIDVCCFLKGLEGVEKQRGWPARSGKVILTIALQRLAEHYGMSEETGVTTGRRAPQAAASAACASARTR